MSNYFDNHRILFSCEPMVLLVHSGSVYTVLRSILLLCACFCLWCTYNFQL